MRKVVLSLGIFILAAIIIRSYEDDMKDFCISLMDMAYPFEQARSWQEEAGSSEEVMEGWIEAALPWNAEPEGQEETPEELDPVIQVSEQEETFTGIPQDHYVTIQGAGGAVDLAELEKRYDENLISNYQKTVSLYNYDSDTMKPSPDFIDGEAFMAEELTLDPVEEGPVVLIFHTHAHEGYIGKEEFGILDVGDCLEQILEEQYGIEVLHHTAIYDAEGVNGAYTRMSEDITKVLEENPSIQVAIDMHRDGVGETTRLVTNVDGRDVAKIMLVTGVSRSFDENGVLQPIEYLPNENLHTVLSLGFQLKMACDAAYPGFMRPLYLSSWRYSTYMLPRSMLLEVGAQTNTLEEAKAAMEPFARVLMAVLTQEP